MGCNLGLALAAHALRHMEGTGRCAVRAMDGDPCMPPMTPTKRTWSTGAYGEDGEGTDTGKGKGVGGDGVQSGGGNAAVRVCATAAPQYQGPTRHMTEWFRPFHQNNSVTCAHTRWFNVTHFAPGIVIATSFGKPVVLWYPSIVTSGGGGGGGGGDDESGDGNTPKHRAPPAKDAKDAKDAKEVRRHGQVNTLSLFVFSHLTQREELLTYRASVNVSYLTPVPESPKKATLALSSQERSVNGTAMVRKYVKLTGSTAHCVQWLIDSYSIDG